MRQFLIRSCLALAAACGISASAHAGGFVVTTAQPVVATTAIVSPLVAVHNVAAHNIAVVPSVVTPVVATPHSVQVQAVPTIVAAPAIVSARNVVRNVIVRQRVLHAFCR